MDDLLRDFLTESAENMAKLDRDIVELEQRPTDVSLLNSVFRTIHTIKGTCGFLGLERLEHVAHAAENVLDDLRAGRLAIEANLIGDVLEAVDCIKAILTHLERTEQESEGDDSVLVGRLEHWLHATSAGKAIAASDANTTDIFSAVAEHETVSAGAAAATQHILLTATTTSSSDTRGGASNDVGGLPDEFAVPAHVLAPSAPDGVDPSSGQPNADKRVGVRRSEDVATESSALADSTLRVSVVVLDELMNLVGELALSRNQLVQLATSHEESVFSNSITQLNRVASDLLEAVMKTRMQRIGNAWTKLPRLVRDLSHASGKQIALEMHGAETELDRQILQAIQDPLTHMIRNSADHGVEQVAARRAAGKSDVGTITLSARHEGGHVLIEISDDGAGISVARVRRKAIERGMVKAEVADTLTDVQMLRYVFEPGFSTAETITNVSGRGVGMDVVRSNIEQIGGTVELNSREGSGTTVRIKLPLTLAIISALLVGAAGETFAVPQIGVVELVRVTEEQRGLVEHVHGAHFYRLRDTLLPLVSLHGLLSLHVDHTDTYNIVVFQVGDDRFGLVVSDVFDTSEVVVKPVGRHVKHLSAYAGCTITGDGRVIMILDPTGIANMAGITGRETRDTVAAAKVRAQATELAHPTESILLFDAGMPTLQAVPLSLVARLEEFSNTDIELADGHFLVQYCGQLMPILPAYPSMDIRSRSPRQVIVFNDRRRTMGVAVDEIRDIVETHLHFQRKATRPGVLGVAVIGERATEVIDTDWFLRQAYGDWHAQPSTAAAGRTQRSVLLVDDSRFFLGLMAPIIRAEGLTVSTAADGKDALARFERGERFDVVMSDIDMGVVDGLQLARTIRNAREWGDPVLIALTAHGGADDRTRGIEAGFDHYLTKLDREQVVATLRGALVAQVVAA